MTKISKFLRKFGQILTLKTQSYKNTGKLDKKKCPNYHLSMIIIDIIPIFKLDLDDINHKMKSIRRIKKKLLQ